MAEQEMLSKLYTLRAGLSAVSMEKDKTDEAMEQYVTSMKEPNGKISDAKWEIKNCERKISETEREIGKKNCRITKEWDDLPNGTWYGDEHVSVRWPNSLQALDEEIARFNSISNTHSNNEDREKKGIIGCVLLAIACTVGTIVALCFCWDYYPMIVSIGATAVLSSILGAVVFYCRGKREGEFCCFYRETWEYLKRSGESLDKLYLEKRQLEQSKAALEHSVSKLKEEIEKQKAECRAVAERARKDKEVRLHSETGKILYAGLEEEFQTFLDSRDWENLDYIIYMLETGRADSMKEALQLVDRARQTEEIIEAVESSSRMICSTLVESTRRLGMLFSQCTERLSLRIDGLSQQMDFANQNLTAQFSDMGKYVSSLTSEVALGNALQAKANETSLELAEEVHALKEHSDYADWRLRNPSYR